MRVRGGGMGGHRVGGHGVAMVRPRLLVEVAGGRICAERLGGDVGDLAEDRSVVGADRGDRLGVGVAGMVGIRVPAWAVMAPATSASRAIAAGMSLSVRGHAWWASASAAWVATSPSGS